GAIGTGFGVGAAAYGGARRLVGAGARRLGEAGRDIVDTARGLSRARSGARPEPKAVSPDQPTTRATGFEPIEGGVSPSIEGDLATTGRRTPVGPGIDPEAGLFGRAPEAERPIRMANLRLRDLFTEAGSRRRVQLSEDGGLLGPTGRKTLGLGVDP